MRTPSVVCVALAGALVLGVLGARAVAHPTFREIDRAMTDEMGRNPEDPALLVRQAQVHRVAHRWAAALATLDHASAHGAPQDLVWAERGFVLLDSGDARNARLAFDRVLAHPPDRPAVRFARGRAWVALGRPARGARDFGLAVRTLAAPTPDHVLAWRDALLMAGRRDEALAALDVGMTRIGAVPALQLAAVDLVLTLDRPAEALRRLDALIAASPPNGFWLARRANLAARLGRPDESVAARRAALLALESRPGPRRSALAAEMRAALAAPSPLREDRP